MSAVRADMAADAVRQSGALLFEDDADTADGDSASQLEFLRKYRTTLSGVTQYAAALRTAVASGSVPVTSEAEAVEVVRCFAQW